MSSGLLAGTFRDHLLAQGIIREQVIQVSELERWRQLLLMMLAAGILLCKGIPRRRWHKVQRHKAHPEEQAEDQTGA